MVNQELFAFWRYDLFPYCLGSKIISFTDQGYVSVEGYGGMVFKPFATVPAEIGIEIKDQLDELENEYRSKTDELREIYIKKVDGVLGNLKPDKG